MKKTFIFALTLVASVLAFTSCNDKKDKEIEEVNPLVGTWKAKIDGGWSIIYYTLEVEETNYTFTDKNNVDTKIKKGTYEVNTKECTGVLHQKTVTIIDGHTNPTNQDEENIRFKYEIKGTTLNLTIGLDWERPQVLTLTKEGEDDPEDPEGPEGPNVDPKKLVKTEWRTDSCFMNGKKTQPPHLYIRILSEDAVLMNGENHNFVINGDKMTCTFFDGMTFTIVEVKEGWAHVKGDNGSDIYLSKLPEKDIESMIMEHKASDFYGTWKLAYFTYNNHTPGYEMEREGTNPGTETWEFKADGSCVYYNWLQDETATGTWECDTYMIKFSKNPAEGTVIDEGEAITVQPLTPNWMCILRSPDGFQYYYWWFVRVK